MTKIINAIFAVVLFVILAFMFTKEGNQDVTVHVGLIFVVISLWIWYCVNQDTICAIRDDVKSCWGILWEDTRKQLLYFLCGIGAFFMFCASVIVLNIILRPIKDYFYKYIYPYLEIIGDMLMYTGGVIVLIVFILAAGYSLFSIIKAWITGKDCDL